MNRYNTNNIHIEFTNQLFYKGDFMPQIIKNISEQPSACILLSVFMFLFSYLENHLLLVSLLKMHRSKTAVKKLNKKYTFSQKLRMSHFKENCLHAVNFCNGLILFQKTGWILLVMYLIISFTWFSGTLIAWLSLWLFMFFTVPSLTIHFVLSRPIIFGRFKEFSFEKYHNTKNHHSLL